MSETTRMYKLQEKLRIIEKELSIIENEQWGELERTHIATAKQYAYEVRVQLERAIRTIKRKGGGT